MAPAVILSTVYLLMLCYAGLASGRDMLAEDLVPLQTSTTGISVYRPLWLLLLKKSLEAKLGFVQPCCRCAESSLQRNSPLYNRGIYQH